MVLPGATLFPNHCCAGISKGSWVNLKFLARMLWLTSCEKLTAQAVCPVSTSTRRNRQACTSESSHTSLSAAPVSYSPVNHQCPILLPFAADYFSLQPFRGATVNVDLLDKKFPAHLHKTTNLALCLQPPAERHPPVIKALRKLGASLDLLPLNDAGPTPGRLTGGKGAEVSVHLVASQNFQPHTFILPAWEFDRERTELASGSYEPGPQLLFINSKIDIGATQSAACCYADTWVQHIIGTACRCLWLTQGYLADDIKSLLFKAATNDDVCSWLICRIFNSSGRFPSHFPKHTIFRGTRIKQMRFTSVPHGLGRWHWHFCWHL